MNKSVPHQPPTDKSNPRENLDELLRLWIFRLLVPLGGYREFVCSYGFGDDALAQYLGLAVLDEKYDVPLVLGNLRQAHEQVETESTSCGLPALLTRNIERVSSLLALDAPARNILAFAVLLQSEPWLQRAVRQIGRVNGSRMIEVLTGVLNMERDSVREALSPEAPLNASGLLRPAARTSEDLLERLYLLSDTMADRMLYFDANAIDLLGDIVAIGEPSRLALADFAHLPILKVLQPYLRHALETRRAGVNVLVHGVPGSGKTQLVGALAQHLDCELFEISAQGPVGDAYDGSARLRAYRVAQGMLLQCRAVVLFDETEDVFNDGLSVALGKGTLQSRKAWMNRILETNPVPAFWLTNAVGSLDPAFVRRFDVVVEAVLPTGKSRQAMVEKMCGDCGTSRELEPLIDSPHLAPAVIERAASVVRSVAKDLPIGDAGPALLKLVDATLMAQGHGALVSAGTRLCPGAYDPGVVSTGADLAELTRGLQRSGAGRLCLYGPPGTGKTAYGRWLAQQLDRPLHARRVSDLVTPFVGETEQNLASAFRQATQERAVLLVDEVDSFLRDRRHAQRSWEVTAVNEMLVQMEGFDGVFIASTNLMEELDHAALRRFDLKVRFGYLKPDQASRLLSAACEALRLGEPTTQDQLLTQSMGTLTPGDFAAVERQNRFRPLGDATAFVAALAAECAAKRASSVRPMGFMASAL